MTTRTTALLICVLLSLVAKSQAALFQFSVGGQVTMSDQPNVSVGDPATILYVANSQDADPNPAIGNFAATRATFLFPNATFASDGFARVRVTLGEDGVDRIRYLDVFFQSPWALVDITFPAGTLTSDALPLQLSASPASAIFQYQYYNISIAGNARSYVSAEVPESYVSGFILLLVLLSSARRRPSGCGERRVESSPV